MSVKGRQGSVIHRGGEKVQDSRQAQHRENKNKRETGTEGKMLVGLTKQHKRATDKQRTQGILHSQN